MVRMDFCDLSHTFHEQVTKVSQHVLLLLRVLMPLLNWVFLGVTVNEMSFKMDVAAMTYMGKDVLDILKVSMCKSAEIELQSR